MSSDTDGGIVLKNETYPSPSWWDNLSDPFSKIFGFRRTENSTAEISRDNSKSNLNNEEISANIVIGEKAREIDRKSRSEDEDSIFAKNESGLEYLLLFKPADTPKQRLIDIFLVNEFGFRSMELFVTTNVVTTSVIVGALLGGYRKHRQAMQTFLRHNQASMYSSAREGTVRMLDYTFAMFLKNGFVLGAQVGLFAGLSMLSASAITAYRNKFSVMYVPLCTGLTGALLKIHMGPRGMVVAGTIGAVFGLMVPVVGAPMLWYAGMGWDELYREARQMHYTNSMKLVKEENEINQIMKDENIFLRFRAKRILRERQLAREEESEATNS